MPARAAAWPAMMLM